MERPQWDSDTLANAAYGHWPLAESLLLTYFGSSRLLNRHVGCAATPGVVEDVDLWVAFSQP